MPALLPIIIGAAIAGPAIGAVVAGAAIAGLAGSLILLGSSLILSGVSRALVKTPEFGDFETKATSRLVNVRQPAAARVLVYGLVRLGGIVTFLDKRGSSGQLLDVVLTLTGHEVEEIGNMHFDDVLVPLDASGVGSAANATGTFAGFVRVQKNLGADSQAALSDLVTASSKWTANHRQRGCAHVWVELKFDSTLFPNGVPQITFDVKGAKVFDTRTSSTAYSVNAALCLRDYLTKTRLKGGAGIAAALIPDSFVDAAANLADEDVTLDLGGTEDRYTCNGTVSTAEEPGKIIQQLLSAMAGRLVFSGGEWQMYGGAWRAPTVSFDEDDLVGPLKVESRLPRRELFNAVKGVIVTSANKWQPSDFPPVTNSTYETEDGERLWKDVDFPFTTSAATAQRLGKLDLETARLQKTVRVRMNLKALQVSPPDVIQLTIARFSWTNKSFEISEQQLVWDDAGEAPALVVEMLLRETASTVYDWTAATDEKQPTAPASLTLPTATSDIENLGPAHSSYRPLSNPLTATDAGANATIPVANFTMRVAGQDISITGNSTDLTVRAFDTVYYVFYDDPLLAGGAVTFDTSTIREDALNSAGRFFVGTIRTPLDGGRDTKGLGDGGGAAQLAGTDLTLYPIDDAAGSGTAFSNPTNAYDKLTATFATGADSDAANDPREHEWFSFEQGSLGIGKFGVTLRVESEVVKTGAGVVTGRIRYSLDGGTIWANIYSVDASRAKQIDNVDLGSDVDISKLRVEARADWNTGASTTVTTDVYEIWIEIDNEGA